MSCLFLFAKQMRTWTGAQREISKSIPPSGEEHTINTKEKRGKRPHTYTLVTTTLHMYVHTTYMGPKPNQRKKWIMYVCMYVLLLTIHSQCMHAASSHHIISHHHCWIKEKEGHISSFLRSLIYVLMLYMYYVSHDSLLHILFFFFFI